jgi:hypothetical protein
MSTTLTRNAAATVLAAALLGGGLTAAQSASAAERPSNDLFNRAENLTSQGCDASSEGSNVGARAQAGEPAGGGKSVWFSWKAPRNDTVVIDTHGSDFDTLLGVYRGGAVNNLSTVAANDDDPEAGDLTSEVTFEARRNVTYKIRVDGFAGHTGDYVLNITC